MDQCFQISLVARTNGLRRKCKTLLLPTSVERIAVARSAQDASMRIAGAAAGGGGDAAVVSDDGGTVVSMRGMCFAEVPVPQNHGSTAGAEPMSWLEWETDVTCLDSLDSLPSHAVLHDAIRLHGYKHGGPRVLHVCGAADADVTRLALRALQPRLGERIFSSFTCAVADQARSVLQDVDEIVFASLDLAALPAGSCDLIILNYETLVSRGWLELGKLLRPFGRVIVHGCRSSGQELDPTAAAALVHQDDQEVAVALRGTDELFGEIFTAELTPRQQQQQRVTLLAQDSQAGLAQGLERHFRADGVDARIAHAGRWFAQPPAEPQDAGLVISLLDLAEPQLFNVTRASFRPLLDRLCSFRGSIIWLVPSVQLSCSDPRPAMMVGLARTIRQEHGADLTVVEVDAATAGRADFPETLSKLCKRLQATWRGGFGAPPSSSSSRGELDPDFEYAVVDGVVKIPRMHWDDMTPLAAPAFRGDDACYLLVGGLGGLGRAVATWMVENGARHLVCLARSAGARPGDKQFAAELESQGCNVLLVPGSVTDRAAVAQAIQQAPRPIAGVMHMAMVLRDNAVAHVSFEEWEDCVRPKVQGAQNLHDALRDVPLDFFVLFSSGSGVTGQVRQANYNAANTFLDAFVPFRHGLGLPASVVDIGVMGDIGVVAENEKVKEQFRSAGNTFITEDQLLAGLHVAVANSRPGSRLSQLCMGISTRKAFSDPSNRISWKRDIRMAIAHNVAPQDSHACDGGNDAVQDEFADIGSIVYSDKVPDRERALKMAKYIGSILSSLLVKHIDDSMLTQSLTALGLDSVITIDLVNWIYQRFHVSMTALDVSQCSSLMGLADAVITGLLRSRL